jgi:hypothetical protein
VLDRAGLAAANGMQGLALAPLLHGAGSVREALLIEEEGQRRDFGRPQRLRMRTLLTPSHRLTLYVDEDFGELHDLVQDPHELRWLAIARSGRRGSAESQARSIGKLVLAATLLFFPASCASPASQPLP